MIIKESEAHKKACCASLCSTLTQAEHCRGSNCMAWRYSMPRILKRTVSLNVFETCAILDEGTPTHTGNQKDYNDAVDALMQRALSDERIRYHLRPKDAGEWSLRGDPMYDEEDFTLFAHHTRERDPDAVGYCGMAGTPCYMGES